MQSSSDHAYYMEMALAEAKKAYHAQEVPVGALVVEEGEVLAIFHNQVQQSHQAIQHAELLAIQAACQQKGANYLPKATLYVTLEPCPMCAQAMAWTQIGTLVFGAADPKRGYRLWKPTLLHPKTKVVEGIQAAESGQLLTSFFAALRTK